MFLMALSLCACHSQRSTADYAGQSLDAPEGDQPDPPRIDDTDEAVGDGTSELPDSSFEDVGDTSTCTEDCSGHDAGYDWARDHDVTDPSDCSGRSQSFVEGCETYASAVEDSDEPDPDGAQ
jgi:hypothetical protein